MFSFSVSDKSFKFLRTPIAKVKRMALDVVSGAFAVPMIVQLHRYACFVVVVDLGELRSASVAGEYRLLAHRSFSL